MVGWDWEYFLAVDMERLGWAVQRKVERAVARKV